MSYCVEELEGNADPKQAAFRASLDTIEPAGSGWAVVTNKALRPGAFILVIDLFGDVMFDAATNSIRQWVVGLFVAAIKHTERPEDRHAAIQWLLK